MQLIVHERSIDQCYVTPSRICRV